MIPPWVFLVAGFAVGGFLGLVIGYSCRQPKIVRVPQLVFPNAKDGPIVFIAQDLTQIEAAIAKYSAEL